MLEEDLNFLGQTPLHLASVNQEISRLLLDAGHRIDTTDKHGITPLMYAAGMGNSQVAQMLILQGADTTRSDARWNRNFIAYASVRGHWSLIFESLDTIRTCYTQRSFHYFVNHALMELIVDNTWIDDLRRAEYFEKLVNLCEDVNLTFENSNTGTNRNNLLHYVRNQKEAQALIHRGFSGFNQPNSDGKLAMNSLVQCPNVELTRYCLENGSYVNHVDLNGRTVIFHLISQLGNYSWLIWDTVDSIKLCLARGADVFLSDNCDCPCVLDGNGCHTSSAFDLGFNINRYGSPPGFMWALEWISIVEDFLGLEASKTMLLSFLRRTQAGMIDITHFCCHRGKGVCERDYGLCRPRILSNEDIREILDEEEEFLEILEEDMQSWEHQSLDIIRSQWMVLLKRKHKVEVKKATEERRDRRQLNQVSEDERLEKKDTTTN
jgi:hypothetical protein